MWDRVKDSQATKHDPSWLIQGMETNSLIWVTDGSYDRKRAPVISGVGWIIFCQMTGKRLVGLFWEKSSLASLYRAELLGLCLLHLVALALFEFYKVSGWKAALGCNNLRTLILSSKERWWIKPSTACLDIHWGFHSTRKNFTGCFKYQQVAGHMDKYLLWHQLSLIQQLNCVCNTTVKRAVHKAIMTGYTSTPTQILTREDISIVIWGNKIENDVSQPVCFRASKELAQKLLTDTRKWPQEQFKEESDMYKMWRSKHHTGLCWTRVQVGKYSGHECPGTKCPTCGRRETAEHILTCPNKDRTRLLVETTEDLSTWLNQEHLTDLELAYWIPNYIMMWGDKPFASLGAMSSRMKALAISQEDKIGWRNFMEGCIFTHFYFIQH
jgi:hypothetical protein